VRPSGQVSTRATVAGATGWFCAAVCAATGAVAGTSDTATTRAAAKDDAPAVVADLISESLRPDDMQGGFLRG
jgi:hypothetical protein